MKRAYLLILLLSLSACLGKRGYGPTDQEWGYETIREGAYMFWWLHYTTADSINPTTKPLVIWLQGGPGASSTGFGNFGEVGPLNEYLEDRKYAWTKNYNVLFVDNPVGTGFSYVDNTSALTTNNRQIADDFLVLLQNFYIKFPNFTKTPLYIFCESYGGKMTAEIGLVLYKAQEEGRIASNLKGVGLGDSWISPIDTISTWGSYLFNQGLVDDFGLNLIQESAKSVSDAYNRGDFVRATELWESLENTVEFAAGNVDFYNILTKIKVNEMNGRKTPFSLNAVDEEAIARIMNNQVKETLGLKQSWVSQSQEVFDALRGDFMRPVTDIVEKLLNQTDLDVVIYNGQLDLIVDTPGTVQWVNNLKWKGAKEWIKKQHSLIVVNGTIEGFSKRIGKLTFYWISRAGHMVPYDNPQAMDFVLKNTIKVN